MELALSLGDSPKPFSFLDKSKDLGFCMPVPGAEDHEPGSSSDPPVQLDLLPFSPVHRSHAAPSNKSPFTWLNEKLLGRTGPEIDREEGGQSFFQMGVSIFRGQKRDFEQININNNNNNNNNEEEEEERGTPSRGSDDEEIGRKKLRLTKEQSAFLEQSFKEHPTLNPKQKIGLANQLNLRPRQVEVWFQNRRARTKLKQTEVDCEYLKKCRETLTEENRRLQKELNELRALKASKPFYMQLPATTLTMCPSCERVAAAGTAGTAAASNDNRLSLSSSHDTKSQQATS